jgi:hypothetical protein
LALKLIEDREKGAILGRAVADILIFSFGSSVPVAFGDNTIVGLVAEDWSCPLEPTIQDPTDPAE